MQQGEKTQRQGLDKKAKAREVLVTNVANKDTLRDNARLLKGEDRAIIGFHRNSCTTLASFHGSGISGEQETPTARAKA